jgi:hypothetical protein
MKRFILSALFFIALLSIWHLLVLAKVWSVVLLPDPISVWEYLKGAAGDGTLLQASLVTMRRLLAGYVIGIAAGLPLGLLTARCNRSRALGRGLGCIKPEKTTRQTKTYLIKFAPEPGQALDEVRRELALEGADLKGAMWSLRGNTWNLSEDRQEQRKNVCRQYTKLAAR